MQKEFIEVPRTARYYVVGNTVNPKEIWFCLHGYGQQSKYFIAKLKALDNGENLIVVPEGLNRFYLSGYHGRVGATWMTSDDRLVDIEDNHRYLNLLADHIIGKYSLSNFTFNLFAFSQGISTACRWLSTTNYSFERAILWAGSIPPEMDWKKHAKKFNELRIQYVFGDEDEFFKVEKINENTILFDNAQIDYQLITFEGKHEIIEKELISLL